MQKIIIVTESGSDITPELAAKYNIQVVPMHVNFENETLDDGTFPVQKIVDYYKATGKLPKTSGSMPEDFIKTFDNIHEKWPEAHILYLAYSAITTVSYQSAVIAAEDRDYITMYDTKHLSVGLCAIVSEVGEYMLAHPDATVEEVLEVAKNYSEKARMCFVPDNLEFLRAGGRVSNAAYLGATILGLHPCIELIDGKLTATKKFRGKMKKVAKELITEYAEKYKLNRDVLWIIHIIGLKDEVRSVIEATAQECGFKELRWIQAQGVITTHGGPAAFGIAGFSEE